MIDYFLADDLSGALDAAAAFHHVGRRVRVVLSERWVRLADDDVIGVTTETRNAPASVAAAAVARAIAHADAHGARLVYKKIDSTLRGQVAAELEALAAALPEAKLLLAPANPAVGRTVAEGRLLVNGVPVAETEFGRDPVCPVRRSDVRSFTGGVAEARIRVPDTRDECDLAGAVAELAASGGAWVAVGSGALARPVAAALPGARPRREERKAPPAEAPAGSRILLVSGSAHPANRAQAALLAQRMNVTVRELALAEPGLAVEAAIRDLAERNVAILQVETTRRESRRILDAVRATVLQILERSGVERVFVTGGETAYAICQGLGVTSLVFTREVEAGLSVSRASDGHRPLLLAVKPGGFGDELTWIRAHAALAAV